MNQYHTPVKHFTATTPEILQKIESAPVLFVAVAATAPSITTPSMALGNASMLSNGKTAAEWAREHGGKWNTRQRLRAMSIQGIADIDLDECTVAQRLELHEAISKKPVFIDDATVYLSYLSTGHYPVPSQIFDLVLVTKILYPAEILKLNDYAAMGCELSAAFVKSKRTAKFDDICLAVGLIPQLGKFPPDREWSLDNLGHFHQDALSRKSLRVRQAFAAMVGANDPLNIYSILMQHSAAGSFMDYQAAQRVLARMHSNGMTVSMDSAQEIERARYEAIPGIVQDLIDHVPALAAVKGQLESVTEHASAEVRRALGAYAASQGRGLQCGDDGLPMIGADEVSLAGHNSTPGLVAWAALEACKREMRGAIDMRMRSRAGLSPKFRQIHPVTAITAVTGRTTCKWPNAQGLDESTKSIVRTRPGHVLIEADFGAIEIRIVAAQCVQAMQAAEIIIAGNGDSWVRQALRFGADSIDIHRPAFDSESFHRIAYWYQQALRKSLPLVTLLRDGLCPHNFTAAQMAIRAGDMKLPDGVSLDQFMKSVSKEEMKRLVGEHRDAAKLLNLSLIYLRKAGGLHRQGKIDGVAWTREEAVEARDAWFDQFPEVAFMGELVIALSVSDEPREMMVANRYEGGAKIRTCHWLSSQTLSGRHIVTLDDRIINARAQGAGADILMRTLASLGETIQQNLAMVVHDSIVFEAPEDEIDDYAFAIQEIMNESASFYLEPYGIPSVVEVTVGNNWAEMR